MSEEYYIDRIEFADIQEFMKKHEHSNVFTLRYSGGSGIGTNIYISCCECLKEKDVTNYASW